MTRTYSVDPRVLVASLCLSVCLSTPLLAQRADRAVISGVVTDQQGAAMPGATVTIHNEATGVDTIVITELDARNILGRVDHNFTKGGNAEFDNGNTFQLPSGTEAEWKPLPSPQTALRSPSRMRGCQTARFRNALSRPRSGRSR